MGLLEELLDMSAGWPAWQSDAARRIFATGRLGEQDLADVRAILEETEGAPNPIRLSASHIPTLGDGQTTVLLELRGLQYVNRFAPGSGIQFNPEGLNIVFGTNGAGKSGYFRVLKRACRARRSVAVLPDAFAEARGTPSAEVVVLDEEGNPRLYEWQEGIQSDNRLAMVAVHDSHCSEDYITQEGRCDYQPYGLPQLGELTKGMMRVQASIRQEREAIRLDASLFDALKGAHSVGEAIDTLSADTNLDHVRQLGVFNKEHEARIVEIDQLLANLDLEPQAKAMDGLATRLDQVATKCRSIESVSSDRAVDRLHELHVAVLVAIDADRLAQALLKGASDDISGTGSETWKNLFKAAEAFSMEVYPHAGRHPSTDEGAHCVLCQQPLPESAMERLNRFRTYVASEAATALNTASTALSNAVQKVVVSSADVIDEATLADLREVDTATADLISAHQNAWSARQQWATEAYATGNWCCPRPAPAPHPTLSDVLVEKVASCRVKAAELRAAKDQARIQALTNEKVTLAAKRGLATALPSVEKYVHDARKVGHLKSLEDRLQTKALSARITKMSQKHITEELLQAMNTELAWLGARMQKPAMRSRTEFGENMITLTLENASSPPGMILSEGEQRAMGLAMFLAEVRLRRDKSTLIFDDPSTSLDHRFRKKMARRLVELAKERQVIVFTHDAVFLTELRTAANGQAQEPKLQTIEWASQRPGSVMEGLTWENGKFFSQLDRIRKEAADLEARCNDQLNNAECLHVRKLYGMLRGALERGIREVVLHDVVHPFSDQVKIENVGAVIGFTLEDWKAIVELHDECSGVTAAHDTPSDRQQEIPHPSELLETLKAIRLVFERCKARNSEFETTTLTPHRAKRSALRKG